MELLTHTEMVILDTSIWIGLLDNTDSCNEKARNIVKNFYHKDLIVYDFVYTEILTVLRNKKLNLICRKIIEFLYEAELKVILSDENIFTLAHKFFFENLRLSFTDCLLMASAKINNAELVTFDKYLQKAWEKVST